MKKHLKFLSLLIVLPFVLLLFSCKKDNFVYFRFDNIDYFTLSEEEYKSGVWPADPNLMDYGVDGVFDGWCISDHPEEFVYPGENLDRYFEFGSIVLEGKCHIDITFKNYDGSILYTERVESIYGKVNNPWELAIRPRDERASYEFIGWSNGETTYNRSDYYIYAGLNNVYTAQYSETINDYKVTWVYGDEWYQEYTESYKYGETPYYSGEIPTKDADSWDELYKYEFIGWDKEIKNVTCDEVYTAQFRKIPKAINIIFKNYDGELLEVVDGKFGEVPTYSGNIPTKPNDNSYKYEFIGWDKELKEATEIEEVYIAQFKKCFEQIWVNYDGEILLSKTVEHVEEYTGETPEYIITEFEDDNFGGQTIYYKYDFIEWENGELSHGELICTAKFGTVKRRRYEIRYIFTENGELVRYKHFCYEGDTIKVRNDIFSKKDGLVFYGWIASVFKGNYRNEYTEKKPGEYFRCEMDTYLYPSWALVCTHCDGDGCVKCNHTGAEKMQGPEVTWTQDTYYGTSTGRYNAGASTNYYGEGYVEYSIDGINWQTSGVFNNLSSGTYQFYCRIIPDNSGYNGFIVSKPTNVSIV